MQMENLYWVLLRLIWQSVGNRQSYGHVENPLTSPGISTKAQCSTSGYYTLKVHGPLVAILYKSTSDKSGGTVTQASKEKNIIQ